MTVSCKPLLRYLQVSIFNKTILPALDYSGSQNPPIIMKGLSFKYQGHMCMPLLAGIPQCYYVAMLTFYLIFLCTKRFN